MVEGVNYKAGPLSSKAFVVFSLTTTLTTEEADLLGLEEAPSFLYHHIPASLGLVTNLQFTSKLQRMC